MIPEWKYSIKHKKNTSKDCFPLLTFSLALSWSNISWISCFQSSWREWKESLGISKKPDSSIAVRWPRILAKEGRECGSGFQQSRTGQRQATIKHLLVRRLEMMRGTLLIPSGWERHVHCVILSPISLFHWLLCYHESSVEFLNYHLYFVSTCK